MPDISLTMLEKYMIPYGLNILYSVIILIVGRWLIKALTNGLRRMLLRWHIDRTLVNFGANVAYTTLLILVVIATLNQLGVHTTSVAAVMAAASVAIGLAFKDSLSNLAAGIMLIATRPFLVGDYIEASGVAGTVDTIAMVATRLKTASNTLIVIPNSLILKSNITNYTATPLRHMKLEVRISYESDLALAKQVIYALLTKEPRILDAPPATITTQNLVEKGVTLAVSPWVKTADYDAVLSDIAERIKLACDKEGITLV